MRMKIIIGLGHPAHYHLFKNFIKYCDVKLMDYKIIILNKDILEELLKRENISYTKLISKTKTKNVYTKLKELKLANKKFNEIADEFKPNLLIGCINQIAFYSSKKRIPSLFFAEDDFKATFIQGFLIYPFITNILTPVSTSVGPFKNKQVKYESFHELAYLHPNHFSPDKSKIRQLINDNNPYYILRFSDLKAYHDINKGGITNKLAKKLIELLSEKGNVYITSEKPLDKLFEPYRIQIPSNHMHHALYYADIFIGDSQTMAAEAAILGTPALRFNNFVGKLGYLEELEHKYKLTFGFRPEQDKELILRTKELLFHKSLKEVWQNRRAKLLEEKIDYSKFMIWFIENYPKSQQIMKENPDYQYNFK